MTRPAGTTLGGAVGEASPAAPPSQRRRGALIGVAGVVVAGGAALAIVLGGGRSDNTPPGAAPRSTFVDPAPPPATPAEIAPASTASAVKDVTTPAVASEVLLHFASNPPGADVFRVPSGVRVGVTPLDLKARAVDGEVVFVIRKSGYLEQEVALRGDVSGTATVELARTGHARNKASRPAEVQPAKPPAAATAPAPPPAAAPEPAKPEKKRTKGEALDPLGD